MKLTIPGYHNREVVAIQSDYELCHFKDWLFKEVPDHYHNFFEILYVISGGITYIIEGRSYVLRPGDILLINHNEIHKPIITPALSYERIIIWISPDFVFRHATAETNLMACFDANKRNKSNLLRLNLDVQESIRDIILKLEKIQIESSFGHDLLKEVYLIELLVCVNKACLNIKSEELENDIRYDENIENVLQYINKNLDKDLSLENLANRFHMDKYHLLRRFKKNVGYTVYNYIKQKRLMKARVLLNRNLSITEICSKCGFEDYSNFIRTFKKAYGLPPGKYAKIVLTRR